MIENATAAPNNRVTRIMMRRGSVQAPGVVLVIVLLALVLLAALVMYVFNLSHHVNQRRQLQDMADASAQSGASWMARGLNTVAMNNVAIARLIAAVNVIDAMPRSVAFSLIDQSTVNMSLREQLRRGVNGFWVREALQGIRDELETEVRLLEPVDAVLRSQDISALTHHTSPTGRGMFWVAMEAADTVSETVMETLDVLAGSAARDAVEANAKIATASVMLPSLPEVAWRHGHFDDFRRPVTMGRLPDATDDQIIRRGPWDAVFGWRDLIGGTQDGFFVPGSIQNAGGGNPNVPLGRAAGRGNGHWVVTNREPEAYRAFGPFAWMLRRMTVLRDAHLWHSRFDRWVSRIASHKLHRLWPSAGNDGQGAILREPVYITDFEEALDLATSDPEQIVETVFVAVEVKSRTPLISAGDREAWTYLEGPGNRRSPRIIRVRGWENPLDWGVRKVVDHVWRDNWRYLVLADPEIGILPVTGSDGTTLVPQDAYRIDDYIFVGINVGTPVEIRNPNNFENRAQLPAPIDLQAPADHPNTARAKGFRTLGVVQQSDRAPMWPTRFTGRKPYPHIVATAQCSVFNNHSWDAWTQMWHVRVEPVSDYAGWVHAAEAAAAHSSSCGDPPCDDHEPPMVELATYLRATTDLAAAMMSH